MVMLMLMSLYFITNIYSVFAAEFVPVIMWESSSDTKPSKSISALSKISSDDFIDLVMKSIRQAEVVVVFAEENLSIEDFSWQDVEGFGSFPYLQNMTESKNNTLTYLPFVHAPLHSLKNLPQLNHKWHNIKLLPEGLSDDVSFANETFLIVKLEDATTTENRPDLLKRHDLFMMDMYNMLLDKHSRVLALYTARHSSWHFGREVKVRKARSLLQTTEEDAEEDTKEPDAILYNGTSIFLHTTSYPVLIYGVNKTRLELKEVVNVTGDTDAEDRPQLSIIFTNPDGYITLLFGSHTNGYWSLDTANVSFFDGTRDIEDVLTVKGIGAPLSFSYHCQLIEFQNVTSKVTLLFTNVQVQPWLTGAQFDEALDCVHFMTVPILSGLFVSFLMAFIAIFGLAMIMDIKTMDRFDDPKGKTITINTSE